MVSGRKHFANARLLTSLGIAVLLFAAFLFVPHVLGFTPLDTMASPVAARQEIALMTHTQRLGHLALTAIIDSLFPLAYGYLFMGVATRFWGRFGPYLCVIVAILVGTDFLENLVQIIALLGWTDFLGAKSFLTPLKLLLFFGGWIMVAVSIPICLVRKAMPR